MLTGRVHRIQKQVASGVLWTIDLPRLLPFTLDIERCYSGNGEPDDSDLEPERPLNNSRMKHLIQSRAFVVGCTFGLILCGMLNYSTYLNNWCNENIYDCYWSVGFPRPFAWGQGGFMVLEGFIWLGLVTDIFFAVTASVLVGWFFCLLTQRAQ